MRSHSATVSDILASTSFSKRYTVKKQPSSSSSVHPVEPQSEQDEEWHKFDDDKVSVVGRDKITTLEGGGEDSAAYILVYRCVLTPLSPFWTFCLSCASNRDLLLNFPANLTSQIQASGIDMFFRPFSLSPLAPCSSQKPPFVEIPSPPLPLALFFRT